MHSAILDCEVVTPMFIAGVDKQQPEMRAPSIKGVMRFWWRAANYGISTDTGILKDDGELLNVLKQKEEEIFGRIGKEHGRSGVTIRVLKAPSIAISTDTRLFNNRRYNEYPGAAYLLYSMLLTNSKRQSCFAPGSLFTISLSSMKYDFLKEALNAFVSTSFFGALGARSRRGAGAFRVNKINLKTEWETEGNKSINETDEKKFYEDIFNVSCIKDCKQLKEHFEKIKPMIKGIPSESYSTLKKGSVYILKTKNGCRSWCDALDMIGKTYSDFRKTIASNKLLRGNFGIPVIFKTGTEIIGMNQLKDGEAPDIVRRASPLIFKVIKTADDIYFPVIIRLQGDFLPKGYMLADKKLPDTDGIYADNVGNSILEKFLDRFIDKMEVVL